jgi:hypothetical protein
MSQSLLDVRFAPKWFCAFNAFYAWWFHFPQSGALAEGTSADTSAGLYALTLIGRQAHTKRTSNPLATEMLD